MIKSVRALSHRQNMFHPRPTSRHVHTSAKKQTLQSLREQNKRPARGIHATKSISSVSFRKYKSDNSSRTRHKT